jgi:hypothetical protein
VEYAINTASGTTPASGWQSGTTFNGLTSGTAYYVHARTAVNDNYNAGATRVSAAINTTGVTMPSIAITSIGLDALKVGQAVDGAIRYTLTNGTFVSSITTANFAVSGLPAGLTAGTATRLTNTTVAVAITGTPTTYNASAANVTLPASIPQGNVTGATAAITPTGTVSASAVARGDGAAVSGAPTVSGTPTANSITVNAVTVPTNPGSQTVEYAISTTTTTPTTGWQAGTTFGSLTAATTYYVHARTVANTNYNAGTTRVSAAINTAGAAMPSIAITATGLGSLKVGQAVSGASITYTLTNGTYATAITAANFAVSGLPAGLTAAAASRASGTVVTVSITGTPTTFNASTANVTLPASIPQGNVTGATAAITPTGTVQASAVARGDGAAVSGAPTVSGTPTTNSITVNAVTNAGSTGQAVEYAINTASGTTPASGWQSGTTFTGLTSGTAYFVHARTVANTNYNAGATRVSAAINTAGAAMPSIAITATGLGSLKVGQAVSGASITYTLTNGTYATSITAANFAVSGLPAGLTAGTATRLTNTTVAVAITGTPTTFSASAANVTLPASIPQSNVSGATITYTLTNGTYSTPITAANFAVSGLPAGLTAGTASRTSGTVVTISITGTPTTFSASAVARGDGAAVSGAPTVSGTPTQTSITVNAVTNAGSTGQAVEYAISTTTATPSTGWQSGTTFGSLTAATTYYVHARTVANTNYNAGAVQRSAGIATAAASVNPNPTLPGNYGNGNNL